MLKVFKWKLAKLLWLGENIPLFIMLELFVAFAIEVPNYLSVLNLQQLLRDFSEPTLVAMALGIVILSGGIDLSVGATFVLSNFVALYLFRIQELSLPIVILGTFCTGILIGMFNGYLIAYVKTRAFLTTLATLIILRAIYDMLVLSYTIELATAMHDTESWYQLGTGFYFGIPINTLVLLLIVAVMYFYLKHIRYGIHLMAVGGDLKAARHAGINVNRVIFSAYVFSGGITAIAGLLFAAKQNSASSDTGLGWELTALTAVILSGISLNGGRGNILKIVIGSAILFLLSSGLLRLNIPGSLTSALIGLVLIIAAGISIRFKSLGDKNNFFNVSKVSSSIHRNKSETKNNELVKPSPLIALSIRNVKKMYRTNVILENINLDFYTGEIHSLIGENGAGKSTLAKIMSGTIKLTSGSIVINGKRCLFNSPMDARRAGVVMVYQECSLVPDMTVAQNLKLGIEDLYNRTNKNYFDKKTIFTLLNADIDPSSYVSDLNRAQQQLVEIARASSLEAEIIIFDESSASLTPLETQALHYVLHTLRDKGVSVIYITHALNEALQISDRISILREGLLIETKAAKQYQYDDLVNGMLGNNSIKSKQAGLRKHNRNTGEKRLRIEDLTLDGIFDKLSFSLSAGEVVGLAGQLNSGRSEIAKFISGVSRVNSLRTGKVLLDEKAVNYKYPQQAMREGVIYVTADRKKDGLFPSMSVAQNIYLGYVCQYKYWFNCYSRKSEKIIASDWVDKLSIKIISLGQKVADLSGGNQQKVLLAEYLTKEPEIIFLDEPTRGVDVGVLPDIYEIIQSLAEQGKTVLVISSSLPELVSISDRVLVLRQGKFSYDLRRSDINEDTIINAVMGRYLKH